jgi:hypothetical protein
MIEKLGEDGATFVHERLQAGRARHGRRSVHGLQVGDSPESPEPHARQELGGARLQINRTLLGVTLSRRGYRVTLK